jgi:hypothetical protein
MRSGWVHGTKWGVSSQAATSKASRPGKLAYGVHTRAILPLCHGVQRARQVRIRRILAIAPIEISKCLQVHARALLIAELSSAAQLNVAPGVTYLPAIVRPPCREFRRRNREVTRLPQ